jgi:hypothetical protein
MILGALNLVHERAFATGDRLRLTNRRGRCAQVDHEGTRAPEARRFAHRLEQVIDAQVPNFPGQWRIDRRSHPMRFREVVRVLRRILANRVKGNCDERLWAATKM